MKPIKNLRLHFDLINYLAKDYNCKVKWNIQMDHCGAYYPLKNMIHLHGVLIYNEEDLWSTFFHELIHAWCVATKRYAKYHTPEQDFTLYRKKMELRVERYVEKEAAKLMKIYFPELKYKYTYWE